jgi:hypothetical protein
MPKSTVSSAHQSSREFLKNKSPQSLSLVNIQITTKHIFGEFSLGFQNKHVWATKHGYAMLQSQSNL